MSGLEEKIESDLSWREQELASLKILTIEATVGSVRQRALLRSLWLLLYAHYEGFCKYVWELFLDFLEETETPTKDCVDELITLSLSKIVRQLKSSASTREIVNFCNSEFSGLLEEVIRFPERPETQSNLWPKVFKEGVTCMGLACQEIDKYTVEIRTLVDRRNAIAHGKNVIVPSIQDYTKYEQRALLVMHDLGVQICDTIEKRLYRR